MSTVIVNHVTIFVLIVIGLRLLCKRQRMTFITQRFGLFSQNRLFHSFVFYHAGIIYHSS